MFSLHCLVKLCLTDWCICASLSASKIGDVLLTLLFHTIKDRHHHYFKFKLSVLFEINLMKNNYAKLFNIMLITKILPLHTQTDTHTHTYIWFCAYTKPHGIFLSSQL